MQSIAAFLPSKVEPKPTPTPSKSQRGRNFVGSIFLFLISLISFSSLSLSKHNSVVVTRHHLATEVGSKILQDGGNAFDAAISVAFALAVVNPSAGNIGGGGFALLYDANK